MIYVKHYCDAEIRYSVNKIYLFIYLFTEQLFASQ